MQELAYLISTEGNFQQAKEKPIIERCAFLEWVVQDLNYNGVQNALKQERPRFLKTHLPHKFFEEQFTKKKPKVIVVMRNLKVHC